MKSSTRVILYEGRIVLRWSTTIFKEYLESLPFGLPRCETKINLLPFFKRYSIVGIACFITAYDVVPLVGIQLVGHRAVDLLGSRAARGIVDAEKPAVAGIGVQRSLIKKPAATDHLIS